jgi:myo-inositol-1(or 4)-monophosphatase
LNGREIRVSQAQTIQDSLLATGFPYSDYSGLEAYMGIFTHLLHHSHGIRRLGSAAVDLAYVACGRFEGFYEYGLNSWDVAAGTLIVKQAGGTVTDFGGGSNFIFGRQIIASNTHIHQEFLALTKKYFA